MEDIAARIDRHVDRSGEHHLWTGATRADGLAMVKVDGRVVTAGRVVWELAHGLLGDGTRVLACPDERTCVRIDHLRLDRDSSASSRRRGGRAPNGTGSKRRVRPGVWKLTVTSGRFDDGTPRRSYRTVRADSATEASRLLADFAAEVRGAAPPTTSRELRDVTVDAAAGLYLDHLCDEKGRAEKTVGDYRLLHDRWFSEAIGGRRLRAVDVGLLDAAFGRMQRAGRSRSTMHHAEALYGGLFRWAKARGIVERNPMADFESNGLSGSMGRVAAAGDNAAMESFFSLLQKNVLDRRRWRTRSELSYATVVWIEHTYNRRRRQRGLGRLTPVEFELAFSPPTAAAHAA